MHTSCSALCVTKLDVLDGLDTIRICVGYRIDGRVVDAPPLIPGQFSACEAVYEELPGWKASTVGITADRDLPPKARTYLDRLQGLVGVPITIVSTGPDREQTIMRRHPFG